MGVGTAFAIIGGLTAGAMLGGKGSGPSYNMPPANWTSMAELQASNTMTRMQQQQELELARMQHEFDLQFQELMNRFDSVPPPEITEYENIEWSDKIAEMEVAAIADIEAMTAVGTASGTLITSPLMWGTEPDIISKSLLGV